MRVHSGEKPYKCHMCDKAFSVSGALNVHMRVHTGDKPYKCSLCNKRFSNSSNLHQHKRSVHSNRRPYHCPYCGKLFKTNTELKLHVRIHTGAKPYSCRHCSDCFRMLRQLKRHLLKSHNEGTWFTCDICQQQFITRGNLKEHSLRRHEDVKPYVCSECPKRFCTAAELRSHRLVHSDYKQFCCGRCGKYFKCKHNCVIHFERCPQKLVFDLLSGSASFVRWNWTFDACCFEVVHSGVEDSPYWNHYLQYLDTGIICFCILHSSKFSVSRYFRPMTHAPETRVINWLRFSFVDFRRRFFVPWCVSGRKISGATNKNVWKY